MQDQAAPGNPPVLPPRLRGPIGVVAVLAALVVAVLGVYCAGDTVGTPLDTSIHSAVTVLWPDPGTGALLLDFIGQPITATALAALLAAVCFALRRRRLAVVAVAGPGLTGCVTTGLKPVVNRTIHGPNLAYPSGHAAAATALAFIVMLLVVHVARPSRTPALILVLAGTGAAAALMSVSQIALDAHYPTDTVGGYCAAMAAVPLAAWLVDRFTERGSTTRSAPGAPGGSTTGHRPEL